MLELLNTSMSCKEHISQVSYLNEWVKTISSDVSKFLTYYFLTSCHIIFIWLWNQILITSDHEIDEYSLCLVKIEVWNMRNVEIIIIWYETLKKNEAFWQQFMSYYKYFKFFSSSLSDISFVSKFKKISEMKEILAFL